MWQAWLKWFHRWSSPKWFYQVSKPWSYSLGILATVCITVALVWGLAFAPADRFQGNSYRIIFIHVPSAFLSQSIYLTMAISGVIGLVWRIKLAFYVIRQSIPIGISLTFLALLTGAIWGEPTWGTWWEWDPRIISTLILLLLYLGLWTLQTSIERTSMADQSMAVLAIIGAINIPIIKFSVDWWQSLHQTATLTFTKKPPMHYSMLIPLLMSILGFYLAYVAVLFKRVRYQILLREQKSRWVQQEIKQWLER